MDKRVPAQICELLDDYMTLLTAELPGLVTGLYLHGSIALDAFNEDLSDIDFIALLNRRANVDDIESLRTIHQAISTKHPRWMLEGSYLQWDELGEPEETISPSPIYHDGILNGQGKFDVNSVTWWVIKHRGIALIGPQPQELPFEVDWQLLITRMKENLNDYWASFLRKPHHIAWLLTDYGIQWTVLGTLRQYYTFVTDDITSKTGAGEYALVHLPTKWHRLIQEAIHLRQQTQLSLYGSKIVRAAEAYNFLRYLINDCNSLSK